MQTYRDAGTLEAALAWEHLRSKSFALQAAILKNHTDAVKVLIEEGVNVNRVNSLVGSTALMSAVTKSQTACVRLLLAVPGVNLSIKDQNGKTALARAKTTIIRDLLVDAAQAKL